MNISKFVAPEIIFGRGSLSQIGESMVRLGVSKVFLVSDAGVINAGWVDLAVHYLHAAGLGTDIFSALSTNPKDFEVSEGVVRYLKSGCDGIVAVGGGAPPMWPRRSPPWRQTAGSFRITKGSTRSPSRCRR